uniref:Protein E6-like n=1 Tax=Kalanchoe fedtschenkoi TaxID=63787 RepID=A0A7N0UG45_KALFE
MATMASLTSLAALFVLLIVQIHARESQFFSKVTSNPADLVELPDRQQSPATKQEEQPEFEPQTQSGYGLYGHETGLFPPSTETKSGVQTHTPGTYSSEKYFNNDRLESEQFQSSNGDTSNKKFNPDSDDDGGDLQNYENDVLDFDNKNNSTNDDLLNFDDETNPNSKTESFDKGGETERYAQTQKGNKFGGGESYYSNFGSRAVQKETDGINDNDVSAYEAYRAQLQSRDGSGRQGMSDTRYLANGRYHYDLNQERVQSQNGGRKTYNPNSNYDANEFGNRADQSDKAVGGGESYKNNFYDNSGGEKYEFNSMEEYERSRQNQYDP